MHLRPFHPADEPAVVALWDRCGLTRPWNDPRKDIRRKLAVRPDLFLVAELDGAVVGMGRRLEPDGPGPTDSDDDPATG